MENDSLDNVKKKKTHTDKIFKKQNKNYTYSHTQYFSNIIITYSFFQLYVIFSPSNHAFNPSL